MSPSLKYLMVASMAASRAASSPMSLTAMLRGAVGAALSVAVMEEETRMDIVLVADTIDPCSPGWMCGEVASTALKNPGGRTRDLLL